MGRASASAQPKGQGLTLHQAHPINTGSSRRLPGRHLRRQPCLHQRANDRVRRPSPGWTQPHCSRPSCTRFEGGQVARRKRAARAMDLATPGRHLRGLGNDTTHSTVREHYCPPSRRGRGSPASSTMSHRSHGGGREAADDAHGRSRRRGWARSGPSRRRSSRGVSRRHGARSGLLGDVGTNTAGGGRLGHGGRRAATINAKPNKAHQRPGQDARRMGRPAGSGSSNRGTSSAGGASTSARRGFGPAGGRGLRDDRAGGGCR